MFSSFFLFAEILPAFFYLQQRLFICKLAAASRQIAVYFVLFYILSVRFLIFFGLRLEKGWILY
ncbi:hypothetical protein C3B58_04530 [Lactonifactor longoviformis]|nr:hypothetical protein C3B58_04530 [Lactonifactor longoviformis]